MTTARSAFVPRCACGGGPGCTNPLADATWGNLTEVPAGSNAPGAWIEVARITLPMGTMVPLWQVLVGVQAQATPSNVQTKLSIGIASRYHFDQLLPLVATGAQFQVTLPFTSLVASVQVGPLNVSCVAGVTVSPSGWNFIPTCVQVNPRYRAIINPPEGEYVP